MRRRSSLKVRKPHGLTLTEVIVAAAVLLVIVGPVLRMITGFFKGFKWRDRQSSAEFVVRNVTDNIQRDWGEMNEIISITAAPPAIVFVMDSNRLPGYNPAQNTGDNIQRRYDPDDDDDAGRLYVSNAASRAVGIDRDDDDDDVIGALGSIDVQCRYTYVPGQRQLVRDFAYNELPNPNAGWTNWQVVGNGVMSFDFEWFGAKAYNPITYDTNNDGTITTAEIDTIGLGGNGNGVLDTASEFDKVVYATFTVTVDANGDGVADARGTDTVFPPLLPLKRRLF